jgi:hypothetical protein
MMGSAQARLLPTLWSLFRFNFQTAKREAFEVTSLRPCGERSPGEATRSRECAPDDRLREAGRVSGSIHKLSSRG